MATKFPREPQRLRLRTKGRLMAKPVLDGIALDSVERAEFTASAVNGLPSVTLHLAVDVVFNGMAWVTLQDIIPAATTDERRAFAEALNEADFIARGAAYRRQRSEVETAIPALLEALDGLGWGFYRKRKTGR